MIQQDFFRTELTSLRAGIPVSHSASPARIDEELMIPATYGPGFLDALESSGLAGSFVKMLEATFTWASTTSLLTWKVSATPAGRSLYQLSASTRDTRGKDSGSLPAARELWPTPLASDGKRGDCPSERARRSPYLPTIMAMRENIEVGSSLRLNATFVEWLMGYPLGWTNPMISDCENATKGESINCED